MIRTGGAGLGGGIVAAILTALGFKARIDTVEKAMEKVMDKAVYKDLCNERYKNITDRLDVQIHELEKQDKKLDAILNKVK